LPTATFSNSEINFFKQFSADGGRIVFIGENVGFYGPNGIATENDFLSKMGAQMTNTGGLVDCGYHNLPASSIRTQHQVATGLTGLTMACASIVNPGPNDFAILYSVDGQSVIAGAAKVDVTPLSTSRVPPRRVLDRAPRASGAGAARTWPNIDPATGQ